VDVEAHAASVLSGRTQQEIAQNLPARKSKRKTASARRTGCEEPAVRRAGRCQSRGRRATGAGKEASGRRLEKIPGARAAEMPGALEPMTLRWPIRPPRGSEWLSK